MRVVKLEMIGNRTAMTETETGDGREVMPTGISMTEGLLMVAELSADQQMSGKEGQRTYHENSRANVQTTPETLGDEVTAETLGDKVITETLGDEVKAETLVDEVIAETMDDMLMIQVLFELHSSVLVHRMYQAVAGSSW